MKLLVTGCWFVVPFRESGGAGDTAQRTSNQQPVTRINLERITTISTIPGDGK
jgi:hypothetical protein